MSDRYAVIGNPISQSKSPTIHHRFAQALGQTLTYERVLVEPDALAFTLDQMRAEGLGGVNVTVPFKLDALAYATHASASATLCGAANALKFDGERVWAENFDGVGLVRDVVINLGREVRGRRVLVLGAGGATRGILWPLLEQQPECLVVANRSANKARELAALAQDHGRVRGCGFEELEPQSFDLIFNATSASLSNEGLPVTPKVFAPESLAYDLAYGKGLTPFLRQAKESGVQGVVDGVGMLVEQAAETFAWWRGTRPPTHDVIRELTVALT